MKLRYVLEPVYQRTEWLLDSTGTFNGFDGEPIYVAKVHAFKPLVFLRDLLKALA